jgi:hypothetical protein
MEAYVKKISIALAPKYSSPNAWRQSDGTCSEMRIYNKNLGSSGGNQVRREKPSSRKLDSMYNVVTAELLLDTPYPKKNRKAPTLCMK